MDKEDSIISELDSEQARAVDELIGKKIWNIEILEDGEQSMVKIEFSEEEGDYLLIMLKVWIYTSLRKNQQSLTKNDLHNRSVLHDLNVTYGKVSKKHDRFISTLMKSRRCIS